MWSHALPIHTAQAMYRDTPPNLDLSVEAKSLAQLRALAKSALRPEGEGNKETEAALRRPRLEFEDVGGIVPDEDLPAMANAGVAGVLGPGATAEEVVACVRAAADARG